MEHRKLHEKDCRIAVPLAFWRAFAAGIMLENIAKHIYDETSKQMRTTPNGAAISSITVWESEVTAATYRP
jgi:hypothetical protein